MRKRVGEGVVKFLFANGFEFGTLVNLVLTYFVVGFREEGLRHFLFIAAMLVYFCVAFITFIKVFRISELTKKTVVVYLLFLGFYLYGFGVSLFKNGFSASLVEYFPKTVIIAGGGFLIGFVGAKKDYGKELLEWLEKGSLIVMPLAVYYAFAHWFNCKNMNWGGGDDVGLLVYVYIALLIMPYMLAHMLSFLFEPKRTIVWFNRELPHSQLIRIILSLIYWIAIMSSGGRTAYVSVICATILMMVVKAFDREGRVRIILPIGVIVLMLFLGFVWRPVGMTAMSRWSFVLDGICNKTFRTYNVKAFDSNEDVEKYVTKREEALAAGADVKKESSDEDNRYEGSGEVVREHVEKGETAAFAREDLYKLALYEFKQHPLIGIGPMQYSIKYGSYPHFFLFELLAEYGVIGTVIYVGVILYILYVWVFVRKKNNSEIVMLCILVAYIARTAGASVWDNNKAVFFAVAYGTMMINNDYLIKRRDVNKKKSD